VLFIDDDMTALSELRREVQSESYTAAFALSGAQAVRQILSACPPDLVVCDVLMPAPNGPEVYRQVVAADARWRARFVFITEPTYDPSVSAFLSSFDGAVLEKPVRGDQLRQRIRRSLAEFDSRMRTASGG
jgi:CheY-like chemotaxis protein